MGRNNLAGKVRFRAGISLLEVLIALSLVAIAILTMIAVFLKGHQLSQAGERMTLSTEKAIELVENVRQMDYELIPETGSFSSAQGDPPVDGFPPPPYEVNASPALEVETQMVTPTLKSVVARVARGRGMKVTLEVYVRP